MWSLWWLSTCHLAWKQPSRKTEMEEHEAGFQYNLIYWFRSDNEFGSLTVVCYSLAWHSSKSSVSSTHTHSLILKIFTEHLLVPYPILGKNVGVKWCSSTWLEFAVYFLNKYLQHMKQYKRKQNTVWYKEQSNIKGQILILLISPQRMRNKSSSPMKSWPRYSTGHTLITSMKPCWL